MASLEALPLLQPQREQCLLSLTSLSMGGTLRRLEPILTRALPSRPQSSLQHNGLDAMGSPWGPGEAPAGPLSTGTPFIHPPVAIISGSVFFVVESTCTQPHCLSCHVPSKTLRATETLPHVLFSVLSVLCASRPLISPEIRGFLPTGNCLGPS